jgi:hypothetical protein
MIFVMMWAATTATQYSGSKYQGSHFLLSFWQDFVWMLAFSLANKTRSRYTMNVFNERMPDSTLTELRDSEVLSIGASTVIVINSIWTVLSSIFQPGFQWIHSKKNKNQHSRCLLDSNVSDFEREYRRNQLLFSSSSCRTCVNTFNKLVQRFWFALIVALTETVETGYSNTHWMHLHPLAVITTSTTNSACSRYIEVHTRYTW